MMASSAARWGFGVMATLAVLTLLRFKPWRQDGAAPGAPQTGQVRQELTVGFLPVT